MTLPDDATLLDILIDGFEKNEMLDGRHQRVLPLADEPAAARKFAALVAEARRWQGDPTRHEHVGPRRVATWARLEIWQAERGVLIQIGAPRFYDWWNDRAIWDGDPLGAVYRWLDEEPTPTDPASTE